MYLHLIFRTRQQISKTRSYSVQVIYEPLLFITTSPRQIGQLLSTEVYISLWE